MSYDVWLEENCSTCGRTATFEVGNYTSNVSPMWQKALGPPSEPWSIRRFDRKTGEECRAALELAVAAMESDPAPYRAMNPPNGWGSYESALAFLKKFLLLCTENPKATVRVWA